MPEEIYTAAQVDALLQQHAQLVDVLTPDDYAEDHIPGAINLPLKELNASTASRLDRSRPVIVYCYDFA
jgi:rhodanese-related sulfurtransferase